MGSGFVASLARPGGNITGLSNSNLDVSAKLAQLLLEFRPGLNRVALLGNPGSSTYRAMRKRLEDAVQGLGIQVFPIDARSAEEIDRAFLQMMRDRVEGLIILSETFLAAKATQIAALSMKHRLPSVMQTPVYAESGGLANYGENIAEAYRHAAIYVDKILKGAKPSDLPVEQPTKFELVINQKTAKALGIKIPQSILIRADRVIE